jgi:hypothetical protein
MAKADTVEKTAFTVSSSACTHYFGFLSQRNKETPIPDECLTCTRMIECRSSEPEPTAVTAEELPESETTEQATEDIVDKPHIISEQPEKEAEASLQQMPEPIEPEKPIEKTTVNSDDNFCVQSPGVLYDQWSGTVLISKETLQLLGKKFKEVEVRTLNGNRMTCKVYVIPDLAPQVIQIPSKLKADLGINDGDYIRVKPIGKQDHTSRRFNSSPIRH